MAAWTSCPTLCTESIKLPQGSRLVNLYVSLGVLIPALHASLVVVRFEVWRGECARQKVWMQRWGWSLHGEWARGSTENMKVWGKEARRPEGENWSEDIKMLRSNAGSNKKKRSEGISPVQRTGGVQGTQQVWETSRDKKEGEDWNQWSCFAPLFHLLKKFSKQLVNIWCDINQ